MAVIGCAGATPARGAGNGGLSWAESVVSGATGAISDKGAETSGASVGVKESNCLEVTTDPAIRNNNISDVLM